MSTLFDELCKDAAADLASGVLLEQAGNPEVNNEVNEIEKKMQETMTNATKKIIDAVNAANDKQVPTETNTETNENQEVNDNDNN